MHVYWKSSTTWEVHRNLVEITRQIVIKGLFSPVVNLSFWSVLIEQTIENRPSHARAPWFYHKQNDSRLKICFFDSFHFVLSPPVPKTPSAIVLRLNETYLRLQLCKGSNTPSLQPDGPIG
jgi:hypothetical protein